MATDATVPTSASANGAEPTSASPLTSKGKGKMVEDTSMDDDDDEEEEEEEEDEDEEMAEEEEFEEIDTSAIITGGRRTRGVRVDYSSAEAHAKAGLQAGEAAEDDENEDSFVARDDDMHD
ncbi:uncharacterized protein BXZ73DRAFT_97768 [Epithele typhae]|uniref:uncharacterized protein n=1 Tax=Epithele typhae TaxID=378194 RepID=UPI0020087386|nr:uncharacterized protein BXZ73DRAFT_97768 [Epithele typhae]KAH9942354.1 hypothetical protein BXZ73DRAFT_97768 [Epithele typhae]